MITYPQGPCLLKHRLQPLRCRVWHPGEIHHIGEMAESGRAACGAWSSEGYTSKVALDARITLTDKIGRQRLRDGAAERVAGHDRVRPTNKAGHPHARELRFQSLDACSSHAHNGVRYSNWSGNRGHVDVITYQGGHGRNVAAKTAPGLHKSENVGTGNAAAGNTSQPGTAAAHPLHTPAPQQRISRRAAEWSTAPRAICETGPTAPCARHFPRPQWLARQFGSVLAGCAQAPKQALPPSQPHGLRIPVPCATFSMRKLNPQRLVVQVDASLTG